jgi:short subunit dehydrogenase-like uncharacterized protein
MAARTGVVLNLVGPYTLYGEPVIEACVENGAHYADLTGEIPFARQMVERFDAAAAKAGVKVVEICGFEALPPDIAVQLAAEAARERWQEGLAEADLRATMNSPGPPRPSDISGGTLQSLAAVTGSEDPSSQTDPAALITDSAPAAKVRARSPISLAPRRDPDGAVIAPMAPMAFINPAVIHRTALLSAADAAAEFEPFRYREGIAIPGAAATLPLRFAAAGMLAGTQVAVGAMSKAGPSLRKPLSRGLGKMLPSSGFGPPEDRLEDWTWTLSLEARTTGGHAVGVRVEATGQPGYLATARMLGEAGLMLAAPGVTPERAGCLTPATALGTGSVERFEAAKLRFTVAP